MPVITSREFLDSRPPTRSDPHSSTCLFLDSHPPTRSDPHSSSCLFAVQRNQSIHCVLTFPFIFSFILLCVVLQAQRAFLWVHWIFIFRLLAPILSQSWICGHLVPLYLCRFAASSRRIRPAMRSCMHFNLNRLSVRQMSRISWYVFVAVGLCVCVCVCVCVCGVGIDVIV